MKNHKKTKVAFSAVLVCFTSVSIFAQTASPGSEVNAACAAINEEAKQESAVITKKYTDLINDRSESYKAEASKIKDDSPSPDNVEGLINLDITVTGKDQEIILDLPQVTIKDQKLSMDLPQISMKRQEWSWDNPTLIVTDECRAGLDEVVCENGSYRDDFGNTFPTVDCRTRRGPDICLPSPKMEMRREHVSLDAPEITWSTVEWVMGVPEFTMSKQKMIITVPEVTVKNIQVAVASAQERSLNLSKRSKGETSALSASMKEELAASAGRGITRSFDCQEQLIKNKLNDSIANIDSYISILSKSQEEARLQKNEEFVKTLDDSLNKLISSRSSMQEKISEAIEKLHASRTEALKRAAGTDLKELSI